MSPSMLVAAGATVALVAALMASWTRPAPGLFRHPAVRGAAALFAIAVAVRGVAVRPTLVHADVVAPMLVDCVLQFPEPCANRGQTYGAYGFWALGGLTRLLGHDLPAVFRAMAIVGAINLALLAVLAGRLSGSPYAALLAVAVTGTNPALMRVAASEDMHNLALGLGLLAFIAIDVFAVTRRAAPLLAAVLALGLLVHTRQTFYVFAPGAFLLALARGGRGLWRSPRFWIAGGATAAVLAARVAGGQGAESVLANMAAILLQPGLVPEVLSRHALFDVARFGPLPLLTVAALIWACATRGMPRAMAVVFAVNFVVTYPCGMPSPGVELAQRLSAIALALVLVAMGGAAFLERWVPPASRARVGLVLAGVLFALPPFLPGWRMVQAISPVHREYLAVEAAAAALPPELTLVKLATPDSALAGYARYAGLLERSGRRVRVAPVAELAASPRPWIVLEDIECWTYSFQDLAGGKRQPSEGPGRAIRWDQVLFAHQRSPLRPPPGPRPECRPFVGDDTAIGPQSVLTDPDDDPPFLFYSSAAVPVRFHRLDAVPGP
ncbi:MAG: glycosyltransferase family 39 protein [Candidatus Binatia bacterium]